MATGIKILAPIKWPNLQSLVLNNCDIIHIKIGLEV